MAGDAVCLFAGCAQQGGVASVVDRLPTYFYLDTCSKQLNHTEYNPDFCSLYTSNLVKPCVKKSCSLIA